MNPFLRFMKKLSLCLAAGGSAANWKRKWHFIAGGERSITGEGRPLSWATMSGRR
jgi:hypothetical protein